MIRSWPYPEVRAVVPACPLFLNWLTNGSVFKNRRRTSTQTKNPRARCGTRASGLESGERAPRIFGPPDVAVLYGLADADNSTIVNLYREGGLASIQGLGK